MLDRKLWFMCLCFVYVNYILLTCLSILIILSILKTKPSIVIVVALLLFLTKLDPILRSVSIFEILNYIYSCSCVIFIILSSGVAFILLFILYYWCFLVPIFHLTPLHVICKIETPFNLILRLIIWISTSIFSTISSISQLTILNTLSTTICSIVYIYFGTLSGIVVKCSINFGNNLVNIVSKFLSNAILTSSNEITNARWKITRWWHIMLDVKIIATGLISRVSSKVLCLRHFSDRTNFYIIFIIKSMFFYVHYQIVFLMIVCF